LHFFETIRSFLARVARQQCRTSPPVATDTGANLEDNGPVFMQGCGGGALRFILFFCNVERTRTLHCCDETGLTIPKGIVAKIPAKALADGPFFGNSSWGSVAEVCPVAVGCCREQLKPPPILPRSQPISQRRHRHVQARACCFSCSGNSRLCIGLRLNYVYYFVSYIGHNLLFACMASQQRPFVSIIISL
jgi:hypothetical protein